MVDDPPPILIEGLTKRLGRGVLAIDGLDLVVQTGQIVGLAGPNGAGKSVTMKILLGLVRPSSGRVELFGEPARPGAKALARVGALVDGPGLRPPPLRSGEPAAGGQQRRCGRGGERHRAGTGRRRFGGGDQAPSGTYSHGMRYRLGLAQALLGGPELLLLDEPTTGLDPAHILEIRAAIGRSGRSRRDRRLLQPPARRDRTGVHARRGDASRTPDRLRLGDRATRRARVARRRLPGPGRRRRRRAGLH